MKVVFVYLGPWPGSPGIVCDYLPRITSGAFDDGGYLSIGWLFWSAELQWKFAK